MTIIAAPTQIGSPVRATIPQTMPTNAGTEDPFLLAYLLAQQVDPEVSQLPAEDTTITPVSASRLDSIVLDDHGKPRDEPALHEESIAGFLWLPPGAAPDSGSATPTRAYVADPAGMPARAAATIDFTASGKMARVSDETPGKPEIRGKASEGRHSSAVPGIELSLAPDSVLPLNECVASLHGGDPRREQANGQRTDAQGPLPLSMMVTNSMAVPPRAETPAVISSSVGSQQWTRDLTQQVSVMVDNGTSIAEVRLTPADMGPIEIRLDFSEASPTLSISVQNADTRNALDLALPRLREMLSDSGVTLGGASVEHRDGHAQQRRDEQFVALAPMTVSPPHGSSPDIGPPPSIAPALRLVDTYA